MGSVQNVAMQNAGSHIPHTYIIQLSLQGTVFDWLLMCILYCRHELFLTFSSTDIQKD